VKRILIAEDEPRIASFLEKGLRARAYATTVCTTAAETLETALSGEFDLLILDLGLPDRDGTHVLRELRQHDRHLPVVVLTARDTLDDTVSALEGGADDYVTKPFRFEELVARIRARLREERAAEAAELRIGDTRLDLVARRLEVGRTWHDLTAREFALAEFFFRHPGQVVSREQLLSHIWGYDYEPESNIVEVYVGYLRRKLGPGRISTVRGMGYRLERPPDEVAGGEDMKNEDR
jgi:two-component system, OmpR family, copper resistance phosphate regulon response regulator CusR